MTRRELSVMSAGLLAAIANAQQKAALLPSKVWKFEDLTLKGTSRNVFDGLTHTGYHIDLHETELAAGAMPHAAHKHEHEEIVMIREGTLEATIEGKTWVAGPGGVIYAASNEMHGWKNIGATKAHYFVIALGRPV